MLDLEFLGRPSTVRKTVYQYRTGILKSAVRTAMARAAEGNNTLLARVEPDDFERRVTGPSLFSDRGYVACDIGRVQPSTAIIAQLLQEPPADGLGVETAIFVHGHNPICSHPIWKRILARNLLVCEADLAAENLVAALRCLSQTSNINHDRTLIERDDFQSCFTNPMPADLAELSDRFDQLLLTETDPVTFAFTPPDTDNEHVSSSSFRQRELRKLVFDRHPQALVTLQIALSSWFQKGRTFRGLLTEIYRLSTMLKPSTAAEAKQVVDWILLLLRNEHRLIACTTETASINRAPNPTFIEFEALCRKFLDVEVHNDNFGLGTIELPTELLATRQTDGFLIRRLRLFETLRAHLVKFRLTAWIYSTLSAHIDAALKSSADLAVTDEG